MGFLEEVREAARQLLLKGIDDWYFKEFPYVLELSATGEAASQIPNGIVYFTFPLGPEEYSIKRVMRQSITPTMGGIIAEEAGLLWAEIGVRGTFGLKVKGAKDTTIDPEDPLPTDLGFQLTGGGLSGPGWTRRMLRNVFEKYMQMKANPLYGPNVRMIWHDMKADDHWVVVPETVDISRNVARRHQYPYDIVFKGITKAKNTLGRPSLSNKRGFGKVKQVLGAINKGAQLIAAAVQEASAYQGEVRFYVQSIDSVATNLTQVVSSITDFVNGTTETVSVGRVFLNSTALALEEALELMEAEDNVPAAVRANYQNALDGLHAAMSQIAAYGRTYNQKITPIQKSERGAASDSEDTLTAAKAAGPPDSMLVAEQRRARVNDEDLVNAGAVNTARLRGTYSGFVEYTITNVDTLQAIASRRLGDGALWYDIALINGLKAPYINASGVPGTVKPGDVIVIPQVTTEKVTAVVAGEGSGTSESLLGTDIALFEDSNSLPGRPVLDILIDKRTFKDVATVTGIDNFKQALQLRLWTERGHLPLAPEYGRRRMVGVKGTDAFLTLLRLQTEETLRQDSRVKRLSTIRFDVADDLVEIDVNVTPIGSNNAQNVILSVV